MSPFHGQSLRTVSRRTAPQPDELSLFLRRTALVFGVFAAALFCAWLGQ